MAIDGFILPYALDDHMQSSSIGSIERAQGNDFYGIDHLQVPSAVPMQKDRWGLTFFVKPQLNMLSDNLQHHRQYYPLLTDDPRSIQRIVRCTLDPRQQYGYAWKPGHKIQPITCPFVDPESAFIPFLSNNLQSISGWPDMSLPTFSSKPGLMNEVYIQPDGIVENFETYDVDCVFRNTKGEPILLLMYIWLYYMSHVFRGILVPYIDMFYENEMDFFTRIYRLVLDETNTYVTKVCCSGASIPINIPFGNMFDFNKESAFNTQNKEITIRMKSVGFRAMDPIVISDFNRTVEVFKPAMKAQFRDNYMVAVPKSLRVLFKNRGYPRINTETYELEWWIDKKLWADRSKSFLEMNSLDTVTKLNLQDAVYTGD